jgi:hypothetical protein
MGQESRVKYLISTESQQSERVSRKLVHLIRKLYSVRDLGQNQVHVNTHHSMAEIRANCKKYGLLHEDAQDRMPVITFWKRVSA